MDPKIKSRVEAWLSGPIDEPTRAQIRALMASNEAELVDAFYRDLDFGTGGLRGVMGPGTNRMNIYTVGMATQGFAAYLKKHVAGAIKVAVACDSRNHSPLFARTAADVLTANGIHVYLFDRLRPTPELSFAVRHLGAHGGIVVTASHNPKEYNGYKVYWNDGAQVLPPHDVGIIEEVRKVTSLSDVARGANASLLTAIGAEVDEAYLKRVQTLSVNPAVIRKHHDLPIVYTSLHGTGVTLVPEAMKRFGFTRVSVLESQATPDGDFPTVVSPNPEESEALRLAVAEAEQRGAELVLATDPDADRVGMAVRGDDGKMLLLNGNQAATFLLHYLLGAWKSAGKLDGKQYVVKTIVTTALIARLAERFGVECVEVLTGFKYIAEILRLREGKAEFIGGGEESYGYLVGDFVRDKDAVSACCLLAEAAAWAREQGKSPWQMMKEIYREFGLYKESLVSLTKKGISGVEEIRQMMADLRARPPRTLDGQKVVRFCDFGQRRETDAAGAVKPIALPQSDVLQFHCEDGSVVTARPSGTEPKIKFYFGVTGKLEDPARFAEAWTALDTRVARLKKELKLG